MNFTNEMENHLNYAFFLTGQNWIEHREEFEFVCDDFRKSKTLSDETLFSNFCSEYKVFRGCNREQARKALISLEISCPDPNSFAEAISSLTKRKKRKEDSEATVKTKQVSGISKLMMFWKPEKYPPMDQYSRIGLLRAKHGREVLINGKLDKDFKPEFNSYASDYTSYKVAVDDLFEEFAQKHSETLKSYRKACEFNLEDNLEKSFNYKLFDTMLMILGNRWVPIE